MINTTSENSLRKCLKNCIKELIAIEARLLHDIENVKAFCKPIAKPPAEEETQKSSNNLPAEPSCQSQETPAKPPLPKLAQEKEKEIIEAIMRAKEVMAENAGLQNPEFEYRPEGMFPQLPKPLTKKEKVDQLNKAYGVTSKPPTKPGQKPKEFVKPSESKYTFKNLVKNSYEKNPNKITTENKKKDPRGSSSTKVRENSSARKPSVPKQKLVQEKSGVKIPAVNSRKPVARRDEWLSFHKDSIPQKSSTTVSEKEPEKPQIEILPPQKQQLTPIKYPQTEQIIQKTQDDPIYESISKPNPFAKHLSNLRNSTHVGQTEVSYLNSLASLLSRGKKLTEDYTRMVKVETKRTQLDANVDKMLLAFALQSSANSKIDEGEEENSDEEDEGSADQEKVVSKKSSGKKRLTKMLIPPKTIDSLCSGLGISKSLYLPPPFEALEENEELQKITEFEKKNYFNEEGDDFEDMVSLLSGKGIKSPYGQDLLTDMYSCWYFGEQFASVFAALKEHKAELETITGKIVSHIAKPEVLSILKNLDPKIAAPSKNTEKTEKEATDQASRPSELHAIYKTELKSCLLNSLKARFKQLQDLNGRPGSQDINASLVNFLKELQQTDRLMKASSRLPLIFHSNFSSEELN